MTTFTAPQVRLGLVVPGDSHVDDELWLLAAPDAIPYVTRTIGARDDAMGHDSITEVTQLAEGPEIGAAARRLADVAPHAAAYVDTSISFVRGAGGDTEIAARIRGTLGCPAIVTSTAVAAALQVLGAHTMGVISPYADDLNLRLVAYFEASGVRTVAVRPLSRTYPGGTTSRELGAYPPETLMAEAIQELGSTSMDALFIPCTAVRAVGAIAPLEQHLGIPVVSAIQATMWAVLRLAGVNAGRPVGGTLFTKDALPPSIATSAVSG